MNHDLTSYTSTASWDAQAACAQRPDLPWLADTFLTSRADRDAMRATCTACPARSSCAAHVRDAGVSGGWWAGADRDPAAVCRPVLPGLEDVGPLGGAA